MEDQLYWVWYSQLFFCGSDRPAELLSNFDSPRELYEAGDSLLTGWQLTDKEIDVVHHTSIERAQMICEDCQREGIRIICYPDKEFPVRLRNIYAPPMVIYVKGSLEGIDEQPAVAIVGTRDASAYGASVTERLACDLAAVGMTIISGCAVGIDSFAHCGALKAGGRTIGVLGCGLDVNYPQANYELKQAILQRGALISELPPGTKPSPRFFPIRNRLMAALSLGVLVTEAPIKSGALITAEHALEQGKDLFCVPPHDIFSPHDAGVARFLRDGAIPVFSAQDVLFEYLSDYPHKLDAKKVLDQYAQPFRQKTAGASVAAKPAPELDFNRLEHESSAPEPQGEPLAWDAALSEHAEKVFNLLTNTPQMIDEIMLKSELPMPVVLAELTQLEIGGFAVSCSGNRYTRPVREIVGTPRQEEI